MSLFFAGYGHIAPITPVGKLVTIFYAIIGIPLFLLYLSNIGDIMAKSFKWTYSRLCKCQRGGKPPEQMPSGILKKPEAYRISYLPQHVHGLSTLAPNNTNTVDILSKMNLKSRPPISVTKVEIRRLIW